MPALTEEPSTRFPAPDQSTAPAPAEHRGFSRDGVRLLGKGELKTAITLTVYSASASAAKAIEAAGGKLTVTKPAAEASEA